MAVIYRSIFALAGWTALALQYGLMVQNQPASAIPGLTLNFFSYFTILTNVLVALALTAPAVAPRSRLGRWAASEGVRASIAMYIAVVGLTYHFLLSHVWDPQGLLWVVNGLLHYAAAAFHRLDPDSRLRLGLVALLVHGRVRAGFGSRRHLGRRDAGRLPGDRIGPCGD
jgi:hypothetical protein